MIFLHAFPRRKISAPRPAPLADGLPADAPFPGQVVLVLQGGGALGSYQAGVYQALHQAGIEPDWIIATASPMAPSP